MSERDAAFFSIDCYRIAIMVSAVHCVICAQCRKQHCCSCSWFFFLVGKIKFAAG